MDSRVGENHTKGFVMRLAARLISAPFAAGLVLCFAGCSSNNKGTIEGKSKLTSGPGYDATIKFLESGKGYIFFDFRTDGTVVSGPETTDPERKEEIAKQGEAVMKTGKYKLGSGDKVEFTGPDAKGGGFFTKAGKEFFNVTIDGDNMTITAADGNLKLVRVK